MKDTPLQVALRQVRAEVVSPPSLAVIAVVTAVIAIAGPFQTSSLMNLPERFLYWGIVAPGTWVAGLFGSVLVRESLAGHGLSRPGLLFFRALGSTAMVATFLFCANALIGLDWPNGWEILASVGSVFLICLAIEVLSVINENQRPGPDVAKPSQPAILQRLPLDRRAKLISISAVDHYTEVTTRKGSHLILMRLADAMTEVAPTPGLQIHRSHWVALDEVRKAARSGDGGTVTLSDGRELPIARSRMAAAQASGLFPKSD